MKLTPTPQQEAIIAASLKGNNIVVKALAGSAKTSTCMMVAEAEPKHTLYVAYNKAIATEATTKFPSWVECKTMHSIAWHGVVKGTKYRTKLNGFLDRNDVVTACPDLKDKYDYKIRAAKVEQIISIVTSFCNSSYDTLEDFTEANGVDLFITRQVRLYWSSMVDVKSKTKIHHDTYLKLFQLSKPDLGFTLVVADESQDLNPAILEILLNQKGQKIFIGDPWQSIYGFRDAVNAFDYLPSDYTSLELTTSFRFNQPIADIGRRILEVGGYNGEFIGGGIESTEGATAILAKTNSDLFFKALQYAQDGMSVHIVGGFKDLYSKLYSAMALSSGKLNKVYDKQIAAFRSFEEFKEASATQPELSKILTILSRSSNLHSDISTIKSAETKSSKDADVVLSTAHKSKGLGFCNVSIAEGFIPKGDWWEELDREEQVATLIENQTLNLIYIAITRAEGSVSIPNDIKYFFNL